MKRIKLLISSVTLALFISSPLFAAGGMGGSGAPLASGTQMGQGMGHEGNRSMEKSKVKAKSDDQEMGDRTMDQDRDRVRDPDQAQDQDRMMDQDQQRMMDQDPQSMMDQDQKRMMDQDRAMDQDSQ